MPDVITFDLHIIDTGGSYLISAAAPGVAGDLSPRQLPLAFDPGALPPRTDIVAWVRQAQVPRLRGGEEVRRARDVGGALFQTVFAGEVLAQYRAARARLAPQQRLAVRLHLPAALDAIPWELLYDAENDEFLALAQQATLIRTPLMPRPIEPLVIDGPLRVVAVFASPRGARPINVDRELKRIETALRDPIQRGQTQLDVIRGPGTLDALRRRLNQPVHVLHILCHGDLDAERGEGVLLFEDPQGDAELVSAGLLRLNLEKQRGQTRLVLLNACLGAVSGGDDPFGSVGAALVRGGVAAVIAMQFEIAADSAAELARVFYADLADGQPIDIALTEARRHL